MMTVVYNCLNR